MKAFSAILLTIVATAIAALPAHGAIKSWQGGPFSFLWSDPDNWDPAGVPQDGDDLKFDDNAIPTHVMVNDLINLSVRSLEFPSGSWQLDGNELGIETDIKNSGNGSVEISCAIYGAGLGALLFEAFSVWPDQTATDLRLTGAINLNGHSLVLVAREDASLDLAGPISGNGSIIINAAAYNFWGAAGDVKFSGTAANTFTGSVMLRSDAGSLTLAHIGAKLILDKQSVIAIPGTLIAGTNCTVKLNRSNQIADTTAVSLGAGASLLLQGHTETIGSLDMFGAYSALHGQGLGLGRSLVDTDGATLSVLGNITASNFHSNSVPTIKGKLGLPPGNHAINVSGNQFYGLDIQAQTLGDGGFIKSGTAGLLVDGNNIFNGEVIVAQGILTAASATALGSVAGFTYLSNNATLLLDNAAIYGESLFVRGNRVFGPDAAGSWLEAIGTNIWSGPIILETNLIVTGFNGGRVDFNGLISGPAGLRCLSGTVELSGTDANTYAGSTVVQNPLLLLNKASGVRAYGDPLIVGTDSPFGPLCEVRWLLNYQHLYANATLLYGAQLNLNGYSEDLGAITFESTASITTGTGELGLYGLVTVNASSGAPSDISGRVGLPSGYHEFRINDLDYGLTVSATIVGPGHLRKTGPGFIGLYADNTYTGLTVVDAGVLHIGRSQSLGSPGTGTTVNDGATLSLPVSAAGIPVQETISIRGTGYMNNGALLVPAGSVMRTAFPSIYACLDLTTNATINTVGPLVVDGFISGAGVLTKIGPGTLVFSNANENTYSGDTLVSQGVLELRKPNNTISIPGNLFIGPCAAVAPAVARWFQSGGMNPGSEVTVNANALLDLNGNNQSLSRLNLNDGGDAQTGAGTLSFQGGGTVNVGSLSPLGSHDGSTFTGNIGLTPNASLTFAVSPFAPTPPFYLGPELEVNGSIPAPIENILFERAGLEKTGAGRMRLLGNNSFRGWVDVGGGTLTVGNGTALGAIFFQSGTYIFNNAVLELEGGVNVEGEKLVLNSTALPALAGLPGQSYWSGPVILSRDSIIGAGASSLLQLAGIISGTGNLTKVGTGTLQFGGGAHNTYAGETFVNEGVLLLSKPIAITAVPGSLNIGTPVGAPATAANLTSYQVVGNIFVNRNGLLNLNDQVENVDHLWLSEGGDVATSGGVLAIKTGGSIQVVPGAVTDQASISGVLEFLDGTHIINVGAGPGSNGAPELEISAVVASSGATITLQKNGIGTLRLTANNDYIGTTIANEGVLRIDGSQPQSPIQVNPAGTLQGGGTVGLVDFMNGGVVSPGASPGILNCSSFNSSGQAAGSTLRMELTGPNPGANGYDQLNVNGSVTLSGVTLNLIKQFSPATNAQFTIINNDGIDPVVGTFNGLPQNGSLFAGGEEFRISYTGGTGNDVVLTRTTSGPPPSLRIERVSPSSVRLLWPTNDPAFRLQYSTNLAIVNWTAASPAPAISGTNYVVTNATWGVVSSGAVTPVAWYRLGEADSGAASGLPVANTSTDSAGTIHLTQFGSPVYTDAVSLEAATRVGSSLAVGFNGVNQYLNGALVSTAVDNFGIEAWVKANNGGGLSTGIAYNGTGGNGWGLICGGGQFAAAYGGNAVLALGPVNAGTWTHLALVRDSGVTRLFYNGVEVGNSGAVPNPPTGAFEIGHRFQPIFNEYFNGAVDEVRVFTFAPGRFTPIELLINQSAPTAPAPPARFYRLIKP